LDRGIDRIEGILVSLLLLLLLSRLLGILVERVGVHPIIGEVAGGLLLSPLIFGVVKSSLSLNIFSQFSILMVMLYSGITTDYASYTRHRKEAVFIASGGVLMTFILIYAGARYVLGFSLVASLFMGAILSNTAIEVSAGVLRRRESGKIASLVMGASFADDILAVVVLGVATSLAVTPDGGGSFEEMQSLAVAIAKVLIFLFVTFYILTRLLPKFFDRFVQSKESHLFTIAFLLMFLLAIVARYVGLHEVIGAYLAGLILAKWREEPDPMVRRSILWSRIGGTIDYMITSLFSPIFFGYMGIILGEALSGTTPGGGSLKGLLIIIVILTALSVAGKIIGCGGTTWLMGNGWNESLRVGSVMVGRGALELVLISYGLFIGYIDTLQSAALITVTLLTVFLAPLLHGVFRKG